MKGKTHRAYELIIHFHDPEAIGYSGVRVVGLPQLKTEQSKDVANIFLSQFMLDLGAIDDLEEHTAAEALLDRQRSLHGGPGRDMLDLVWKQDFFQLLIAMLSLSNGAFEVKAPPPIHFIHEG